MRMKNRLVLILPVMKQAWVIKYGENEKMVWQGKLKICQGCVREDMLLLFLMLIVLGRAYLHQHKLWEIPARFTIEGTNEARMIL